MKWVPNLPVQKPTKKIILIWDIIQIFFTGLCMFYIPIDLVTNSHFNDIFGEVWNFFLEISLIIFFANILINFKIGYYDNGNLELD